MAKLRKRQKVHPESPKSSRSKVRKTDSTGPAVLPVIHEQSVLETERLRPITSHEGHPSHNPIRGAPHERVGPGAPESDGTRSKAFSSQQLKSEPPTVTKAQKRPSPLRISQEASPDSDNVIAGPSKLEPEYRRQTCGPSCQKCGRPRKPLLRDASIDEITPAPPTTWPLPDPASGPVPTTSGNATEKVERREETHQPEPTAVPSNERQSRRWKYFSLPTKSKPSFKGPTELASVKGKTAESAGYTKPSEERPRPVSAPSPSKSSSKGPADTTDPNPKSKAIVYVPFATDEHLGRFAGMVSAPDTTTAARIQALRSLTQEPAIDTPSRPISNAGSQTPTSKPEQAPPPQPEALIAAQPTPRANSAILYEWPLITTLVNQPEPKSSTQPSALKNAPSRSSLSISRRPSHRTARPYSDPHIHAPVPGRRTSSRRKTHVQQSRKVSYITDHASNSSHESMSIQILDMLQGFPGGELAATAKTKPDTKPFPERPSLGRLQTHPTDVVATKNSTLTVDRPAGESNEGLYSPSDYSSEDEVDDDEDDDGQAMPATPPQSDFSLASYSIGDDRHFPLKKLSDLNLDRAPAPLSGPSSASGESELVSAESPPSAPSTARPPAQPLTLTLSPSPDSEGLIPVNSRLSIADLPEVISSGSKEDEDEIDPDFLSWGALPGSYGGAGMWSGASNAGLETGALAELGVSHSS